MSKCSRLRGAQPFTQISNFTLLFYTSSEPPKFYATPTLNFLWSDTRGEGMGILGHATSRTGPDDDLRGGQPRLSVLKLGDSYGTRVGCGT